MKLEISRSDLLNALNVVGPVVPSKTTRDIIKNVRPKTVDGVLSAYATDIEISISSTIGEMDCSVDCVVPLQKMQQICRDLTCDTVTLDIGDGLVVRGNGSRFKFSTLNPSEFPEFPSCGVPVFNIGTLTLKKAIQSTIFSVDDDTARFALGGVMLDREDGGVVFVSTDGRRLSVFATHVEFLSDFSVGSIIPVKAIRSVLKMLDMGDVAVAIDEHGVTFTTRDSRLHTRLLEGRFPKYRDVIPSADIEVSVVAGQLLSVVRQAQIVTNSESRSVDFHFHDGTLTLTSRSADVGNSKIEMPVAFDGDVTITLDPKYVCDVLGVIDSPSAVSMKFTDGSSPMLMTEGSSKWVIMPLSRE